MALINKTFMQHISGLGEPIAVRLAQEEKISGLLRDIDINGDLLLESAAASEKRQRIRLDQAYGLT